jgi:hypothetical protein
MLSRKFFFASVGRRDYAPPHNRNSFVIEESHETNPSDVVSRSLPGDRAALEQIYANDYMNLSPATPQNKAQAIDSAVRDAERGRQNTNQPQLTYDYYMINCTPTTATMI